MARSKKSVDELVGQWAMRHHGLITLAAAARMGMTSRQLAVRSRTGRLERMGRSVYRVNGAPETPEQLALAAVWSAGSYAIVGSLSTLALFGLCAYPSVPHLTVPALASARTPGAVVLRSPVGRQDRTSIGPIPSATVPRALLEAARRLDQATLDSLVDSAMDADLARPSTVLGALRRARQGWGRAGSGRLRSSLEPWLGAIEPGSPGEARLVRRIAGWGLPDPVLQHRVDLTSGPRFLDLAWPERLVGLEYDGARFHGPRRLAHDDQREAALRALGWSILRADRHDLAPSSTRLREELQPLLRKPA